MPSARFVRFLAAGGVAALVNFGSRIALSHWLSYPVAIVFAYLCGLVTAFVLNRQFVFYGSTARLRSQALWFTAINVLAVLQTLGVSLALADVALPAMGFSWHVPEVAHAVGIITPVFTSYLGHKHLSFRMGS